MKNINVLKRKLVTISFLIAAVAIIFYLTFQLNVKSTYAEEIVVYKSRSCGCCNKWVKHLKDNGFTVETKDYKDMKPIKRMFGVKEQFQSCHTAQVGNYFIEGHVSASDIKRLLKDKPDIKGLSVPGMPMGSPGMEGHRKDNYDVIAIDKNDATTVYSSH